MAHTTLVNGQTTDAVTQANLLTLAAAPAQSMGLLYQVMAQATGLSMQNAVANQQRLNTLGNALTAQSVNQIYGIPLASSVAGANATLNGGATAAQLAELKVLVRALARRR